MPHGVEAPNQLEFPRSRPALDLLLAFDSRIHVVGFFVIYQLVDVVALGEPLDELMAVFVEAALEVTRHPYVERAFVAGEDVDPVPLHTLRSSLAHQILHCAVAPFRMTNWWRRRDSAALLGRYFDPAAGISQDF